jgi:hypothetical protein
MLSPTFRISKTYSPPVNQKIQMRVQFVAQGLEDNRIVAGVVLGLAEKVVIIRNSNKRLPDLETKVDQRISSVVETITKGKATYFFVKNILWDGKMYSFDFFNLVDALKNLEEWFSEEASSGNHLSVNLSSGPAIANIALFCAGMKYGAEAYYVTPEYYGEELVVGSTKPEILAKGIEGRVTLPRMPLDYLYDVHFEILIALKEGGGSVGSISELVPLIRPADSQLEPSKRSRAIRSEQAKIASQMESLRQLGYVEVRPEGRKKRIAITELGRTILGYKDRSAVPSFDQVVGLQGSQGRPKS